MEADRIKWNQKYQDKSRSSDVVDVLNMYQSELPKGRALDVACGLGRHSYFLADAGFQVDAIDISDIAIQRLDHPRIHGQQVDLDCYQLPVNHYDVILNIAFLDRGLFPQMIDALKLGGYLIFETFLQESEHIKNATFKLKPNELLTAFSSLRVRYYREHQGKASLVAMKELI